MPPAALIRVKNGRRPVIWTMELKSGKWNYNAKSYFRNFPDWEDGRMEFAKTGPLLTKKKGTEMISLTKWRTEMISLTEWQT